MAIYQGLEARLHEAFWGERGSDIEVGAILEMFSEVPGLSLEVGAGVGRVMGPLKEAGWEVEGIEPSQEMVEIYEGRLGEGEESRIYSETLEEFSSDKGYDALLLTSYVLQLFERVDLVFEKMKNLLKPGGLVYMSAFIPWSEIVGELPEGEWSVDDEVRLPNKQLARCWVNFDLDRVGQKLSRRHRYELFEKKKLIEATETTQELRWYTLPEIHLLAEKHGFVVEKIYYDFKEDYDSDAHSLCFVMKRC